MLSRKRILIGIFAVVMFVAAADRWGGRLGREPRYDGRRISSYFPRFEHPYKISYDDSLDNAVEEAGPEAVPYIVKIMNRPESSMQRLWSKCLNKLPSRVEQYLPVPVQPQGTWGPAFSFLQGIMRTSEGVTAVLRAMPEMPEDIQHELVQCLDEMPGVAPQTLPVLTGLLTSKSPNLACEAALSLLALGSAAESALPNVFQYLSTQALEFLSQPVTLVNPAVSRWFRYCRALGELKTKGQPALPILEQLQMAADERVSVEARLAIARIAPETQTFKDILDKELPALGLRGIGQYLRFFVDQTRSKTVSLKANEAVPVLLPFLSIAWTQSLLTNAAPMKHLPITDESALRRTVIEYCGMAVRAVGQFGREATPAAPALLLLLQEPEHGLRRFAAEALLKIGPVDPASVSKLVAALEDDPTNEAIIRLLSAYGSQALAALPKLRQIAVGNARARRFPGSPAYGPVIDVELFQRYPALLARYRTSVDELYPSRRMSAAAVRHIEAAVAIQAR